MIFHVLLGLLSGITVIIQLCRLKEIPAYLKVVVFYLMLHSLSTIDHTANYFGPIVAICVLDAVFLISIAVLRLFYVIKSNCIEYFKLNKLWIKVTKCVKPNNYQTTFLRISALCASIGTAFIVLSVLEPWFTITLTPDDKLLAWNTSLSELDDVLQTIGMDCIVLIICWRKVANRFCKHVYTKCLHLLLYIYMKCIFL